MGAASLLISIAQGYSLVRSKLSEAGAGSGARAARVRTGRKAVAFSRLGWRADAAKFEAMESMVCGHLQGESNHSRVGSVKDSFIRSLTF